MRLSPRAVGVEEANQCESEASQSAVRAEGSQPESVVRAEGSQPQPAPLAQCGSFFSRSILLALGKSRLWERARVASRLRAARRRSASRRLFDAIQQALAQHRVAELLALRSFYADGLAQSAPSPFGVSPPTEGAQPAGFEPWVSLKVGVEGCRWLGAEYEVGLARSCQTPPVLAWQPRTPRRPKCTDL